MTAQPDTGTGRKPRPRALKLVESGKGSSIPRRTEPLTPPRPLDEEEQAHWNRFIEPLWWIDEGDAATALSFVINLKLLCNEGYTMPVAKMTEMRRCAQELHMGASEQTRIGVDIADPGQDPARFFSD